MTRHSGGLQLLAEPMSGAVDPSSAEFVKLFDMLVTHYRYVVVDVSSRFDAASRLIASLQKPFCWSPAAMWRRSGAPPGCSNISASPEAGTRPPGPEPVSQGGRLQ